MVGIYCRREEPLFNVTPHTVNNSRKSYTVIISFHENLGLYFVTLLK